MATTTEHGLVSYNHADALLTYLHQLHLSQRFTDVVIQCEGQVVNYCHRIVLAAYSMHFETALAGVEANGQITLDIDPKVTGVCVEDLRRILEFMYTGRVNTTGTLSKTAKALGVSSLASLFKIDTAIGAMLENENHPTVLLNHCRRYYQEGKFTDVSIHCQGLFMANCHRLVLSAFSDHFEAALASTENCPQVTLDIDSAVTGVSALDLKSIIDFMYYGVVRMPRRRLKSLSAAGKALGVSKLAELLIFSEYPTKYQPSPLIFPTTSTDGVADNSGHVMNRYSMQMTDGQFGVENVGATEDVGGLDPVQEDPLAGVGQSSSSAATSDHQDMTSIATEETMGDEENPDDIYDEYVSGPRRRKNPLGTYRGQMKVKGFHPKQRTVRQQQQQQQSSSSSGHHHHATGGDSGGGSAAVDDQEDLNASLFIQEPHSHLDADSAAANTAEDADIAAVTLSLTAPLAKRRRSYSMDNYGYGLPEIVGTADVTVPLLVGDQQLMMEKPFKCLYCDHRTKEKSALEKHIRCIHTLEAPYKCRYCNQAFKVQSNLVRHIRAHTGEKPYVCKKCGAAYADKKNMDAHVFREHLKMRPLECPSPGCLAKFWRQDRFNYHCRRQHGMEPPDHA